MAERKQPLGDVADLPDMVGAGRFELPTSWSQTRRPAAGPRPVSLVPVALVEKSCGLGRREPLSGWYPRRGSNSHLWLRRPALYPLSYGDTLFNWPKKDTTLAAGVTSRPAGLCQAIWPTYSPSSVGTNFIERELTQCRAPVGVNPSPKKTWPR